MVYEYLMVQYYNFRLFNMNYLNHITQAGQEAYMDLFTQNLARQARGLKQGDQLWKSLNDFGFTADEIADLPKYMETVYGVDRIAASTISDPKLARKMHEYQIQYMNMAVITPDAGTQASIRFGTQDGTWLGVATRQAMQYMSFPAAISNIHYKRYINGYDSSSDFNTRTRMMMDMSSWMGGALGMGYIATVMKDLSMGREPMFLHNMTTAGMGRIYGASGIGGIADVVFDSVIDRDLPVAPLIDLAADIGTSESLPQAMHRGRAFYGGNIPGVAPAMSMILGTGFGDIIPLHIEQAKGDDFFERKYNQRRFIKALPNY
jgi:hypothetical protein